MLLSGDVELNPGPLSNLCNINFATLNIRSASTINSDLDKPAVLQNIILDNSLDILVLTETWLSEDTPSSVLNSLTPPNFSLFHKPRLTGRSVLRSFTGLSLRYLKLYLLPTLHSNLFASV